MPEVTYNVKVVLDVVDKALKKNVDNITKSTKELGQQDKNIFGLGKQYNQLAGAFGRGSTRARQFKKSMFEVGKSVGYTNREMKRVIKSQKGMNFGFLSMIFGGQALSRTFGGMFKAMSQSYKDISDKNSQFNRGILGLSGSFELLKYNIFSAFADSEGVNKALIGIATGLEAIANVFSDHPGWGVAFIAVVGALAGLGSIMTTIGQLVTLKMAADYLAGTLFVAKSAKDAAIAMGISPYMASMMLSTGAIIIGLTVGFALTYLGVKTLSDAFKGLDTDWGKVVKGTLATTFGAALVGFIVGGPAGALIGAIIGFTFSIIFTIVKAGIQNAEGMDIENVPEYNKLLNGETITTPFELDFDLASINTTNSTIGDLNLSFEDLTTSIGLDTNSGLTGSIGEAETASISLNDYVNDTLLTTIGNETNEIYAAGDAYKYYAEQKAKAGKMTSITIGNKTIELQPLNSYSTTGN